MLRRICVGMLVAALGLAMSGCFVVDVLKPAPEVTQRYDAAKELFDGGEYARAEVAFKAFLEMHPKNPLAPWAQYYLGQSYRHQKMYAEAIDALTAFLKAPPSPSIIPIAQYDVAECYLQEGQVKEATDFYGKVIAGQGASKAGAMFAKRAQMRLDEIKVASAEPKKKEKK